MTETPRSQGPDEPSGQGKSPEHGEAAAPASDPDRAAAAQPPHGIRPEPGSGAGAGGGPGGGRIAGVAAAPVVTQTYRGAAQADEPGTEPASPSASEESPPEDAVYQALVNEMGDEPDNTTLREIARTAVPLPDGIVEAWQEWQGIMARRAGEGPLFPNPTLFRLYQLRAGLLEELGLWTLKARSASDCAARLRLLKARANAPTGRLEPEHLMRILDNMTLDLERLDAATAGPGSPGQTLTTATERRAAVISHLCDPEMSRWSDRAIARACGVSPQTVGNWRRKLSDDSGQMEGESSVRLFMRDGRTHRMETRHIGTPTD